MKKSNSLIIIFLSHGKEDYYISATDKFFHISVIKEMLISDELKEMAGRPKFFLIQACRGEKSDSGTMLRASAINDEIDAVKIQDEKIYPNYTDFVVGWSAHHGHYSFRNLDGSWYIQDFCNVFEEANLSRDQILDILTETNRRVTDRTSQSHEDNLNYKKQSSSLYSTLTKKFYLEKPLPIEIPNVKSKTKRKKFCCCW